MLLGLIMQPYAVARHSQPQSQARRSLYLIGSVPVEPRLRHLLLGTGCSCKTHAMLQDLRGVGSVQVIQKECHVHVRTVRTVSI